jgi:Fic family protein
MRRLAIAFTAELRNIRSMRYIHQQPKWPHFQWDYERLMPILGKARHQQGLLLGGMMSLGFQFRQQTNLENLAVEVIKSSAIEGTKFDPASVRSSIARRMGLASEKEGPPSRDVEGAVEMILDATQQYKKPLTEDRLLGWQASLFPAGRSGIHRIAVGKWRTPEMDPMQVVSGPVSRDQVRRKHIHFEAPTADRLPGEVVAFLKWFETVDGTDALLRAAIAHFWFVTIHPFEDGNGRVSRAIADMALARSEGSCMRFYSMSAQIEKEKQEYYHILEASQKGTLDITSWLEWFVGCFERSVIGAGGTLKRIIAKAARWEQFSGMVEPNERQRKVLNTLLDNGEEELSTSKYAKLAGTSLDTALRDIKQLIEAGVLKPGSSGGRSKSYALFPVR